MSIRGYMEELSQIKSEIKSLTSRRATLTKKADAVEIQIIDYLVHKNLPGIKYNGLAIMVENKSKRGRKKASDAKEDSIRILQESGIHHNTEKVLDRLLEARRGDTTEKKKLKILKGGQ